MAGQVSRPAEENDFPSTGIKGLLPGAKLNVRNSPRLVVPDTEKEPPKFFQEYALARLMRTLDSLAAYVRDQTKFVEEYENDSFENVTIGETTITVVSDFAPASELITEILVTGPVTTAFTLLLGDRLLSLSTDATGKCLLSPIAMKLGPQATRQLTSVTSGNWFLHLSGHAMTSRKWG